MIGIDLQLTFNNFFGATFITLGVMLFSAKAFTNISGVTAIATNYYWDI